MLLFVNKESLVSGLIHSYNKTADEEYQGRCERRLTEPRYRDTLLLATRSSHLVDIETRFLRPMTVVHPNALSLSHPTVFW